MAEDLRQEMIEEQDYTEREGGLVQRLLGLSPWQRLVLALLLFLDVALCGLMGLVMIGRMLPPL